jgi:hypothetical protein
VSQVDAVGCFRSSIFGRSFVVLFGRVVLRQDIDRSWVVGILLTVFFVAVVIVSIGSIIGMSVFIGLVVVIVGFIVVVVDIDVLVVVVVIIGFVVVVFVVIVLVVVSVVIFVVIRSLDLRQVVVGAIIQFVRGSGILIGGIEIVVVIMLIVVRRDVVGVILFQLVDRVIGAPLNHEAREVGSKVGRQPIRGLQPARRWSQRWEWRSNDGAQSWRR